MAAVEQHVRLLEGAEGLCPAIFAESFFKQLLQMLDMPITCDVDRAPRDPTGNCPSGAPLRPLLVCFLKFRDRDMILAEARKRRKLLFENT